MDSRHWIVWFGSLILLCASACGGPDGIPSRGDSREVDVLATTGLSLTNGVPVGSLSGLKGSEQLFTLDVPDGMGRLTVTLTRGIGDPDLFVRRGSAPTTTAYDCHSVSSNAVDECVITAPQSGTWYVMVRGYSDYSGASLVASYIPLVSMLGNGQSLEVGGAAGSQRYWTLEVPASQTALRLRTTGGTGNVDLFVSFGAPPTTTSATCTSATSGNEEACSVTSPQAGTWYVMLRGVTDYSGVTLTGYSQAADGGPVVFLPNDTTVSPPRAEAGDAFHYSLEVPAGQTQLRVRLYSGYSGNANLYVRYGDKASLTAYDCRSEAVTTNEECVIANPQAGTWFIQIHSKQATQKVYLQAVYLNGTLPPIALTSGKPLTHLTVLPGAQSRLYTLQVPSGYARLRISVNHSLATVYARLGAAPVPGGSGNKCSSGSSCEVLEPEAGTWYVMVTPSYMLEDATLRAGYSGELAPAMALVNGQALTGLAASKDDIRTFTLNVPADQGRLVFAMSSGAGDPTVYVRAGARPTPSTYSCTQWSLQGPRSCVFNAPSSGTWYLQVHADQEVSDLMVKGTYSPLNPRGPTLPLSNGQWVENLSGTPMVDSLFTLQVPPNAQGLTLESMPGAGEAHVYLKQGAEPTSSDYNCLDRCEVTLPAGGTWYARIRGGEDYSGFAFRVTYQIFPVLPLNEWVGPMPFQINEVRHFRVEVPSGLAALSFETRSTSGRVVAIHTALGSVPVVGVSCNIVQGDGGRRCTLVNPQPGTWYVRVANESLSVGLPDLQLRALADWLPDSTVRLEDNVPVPITDLVGRSRVYTLEVPEGQAQLDVDLLTREDAELSIRHGGAPTTWDFKCKAASTQAQPGASCSVPAPTVGTWYATVRAPHGFKGLLRATTTSRRVLVNGVPEVPVAGALGEERLYRLEVPAGMSDLSFTLRDATHTSHLFVKYGTPPVGTADCTFGLQSKDEDTCAFAQPLAGTWYVAVRGVSAAFSGAVVTGTYVTTPGDGVPSLTRGVTVAGLQGSTYERRLWKLEVPAGQSVLKFDLLSTKGAPELYVQHAARPTSAVYTCKAVGSTGKAATCTVRNPLEGTWFVMARAPYAYTGAYLTGTFWRDGDTPPLTRGVPLPNLSSTSDLAQSFQVEVPPGQSFLSLDLFGSVANAVMTVRYGAPPTASDTACVVKSTSRRACEFQNPASGTWYVRLSGTFSGASLSADHVGFGATDGIEPLMNEGTVLTSSCVAASKPLLYKLEVPSGMSKLTFASQGGAACSSGGAGVDLRVMLGSPPTLNDYDCLSNAPGSAETCTLQNPAAGTWYVLVSGDASDVRVVGSYE